MHWEASKATSLSWANTLACSFINTSSANVISLVTPRVFVSSAVTFYYFVIAPPTCTHIYFWTFCFSSEVSFVSMDTTISPFSCFLVETSYPQFYFPADLSTITSIRSFFLIQIMWRFLQLRFLSRRHLWCYFSFIWLFLSYTL